MFAVGLVEKQKENSKKKKERCRAHFRLPTCKLADCRFSRGALRGF